MSISHHGRLSRAMQRCSLVAAEKIKAPDKYISCFLEDNQQTGVRQGRHRTVPTSSLPQECILEVYQTRSLLLRPELLHEQIGLFFRKTMNMFKLTAFAVPSDDKSCL